METRPTMVIWHSPFSAGGTLPSALVASGLLGNERLSEDCDFQQALEVQAPRLR